MRNYMAALAIVLAFGSLAAFAQGSGNTSTRTIDDQVFRKIISLPYYGVFDHIAFEVRGDTVKLTGKVAEIRNRRDAENAVKRIDGVSRVVNNIEVLPLSPFDDRIRAATLRTFRREGGSLYRYLLEPRPSIRIIVENGRVTLEGKVASEGDSRLANVLARTVPGVFGVTNNLVSREQ